MEAQTLKERLDELMEALINLNNTRHNPSWELEYEARSLFENIIDDITNGY